MRLGRPTRLVPPFRLRHLMNRRNRIRNVMLSRSVGFSLGETALGQEVRFGDSVLALGGAGSGKTALVQANVLQLNASYLVVDGGGRTYRDTRAELTEAGYEVRLLDTGDIAGSAHFNPFAYVERYEDVAPLVSCLLDDYAQRRSDANIGCARMLAVALVAYMLEALPRRKRNFRTVRRLLDMFEPTDEPFPATMPLDVLFSMWETGRMPSSGASADCPDNVLGSLGEGCVAHEDSPAVEQYRRLRVILNDAESQREVLVMLAELLAPLDRPELLALTDYDELDLLDLGGYDELELADRAVLDPNVLRPTGGVRRGVTKHTPNGQRKVAVFVVPAGGTGPSVLATAVVHLALRALARHVLEPGAQLAVPVQVMLDELGALGRVQLTADSVPALERGVSIVACAKSRGEIMARYGEDDARRLLALFDNVVTLDGSCIGEERRGVKLNDDECLVTINGASNRIRPLLPCAVIDKKLVPRQEGERAPRRGGLFRRRTS